MSASPIFAEAAASWRDVRAAYEDVLEAAFVAAESATRGNLLNRRGADAGIDPRSLFLGNETRARAYASDELLAFWQHHPRMTFAQFERGRTDRPHVCPSCGDVA